jgi:hypothetical protein
MCPLTRVLAVTLLLTVSAPTISTVLSLVLQAIHQLTAIATNRINFCGQETAVKLPTSEHHSPQHEVETINRETQ